MSPTRDTKNPDWQVLDARTVQGLTRERDGAAVVGALLSETPTPATRARELEHLAEAGRLTELAERAEALQRWADGYGLRRICNALIELDRACAHGARGQAILQAQSLARFVALHIDADVAALRDVLGRA